jgi:hypothetical protein
MVATWSETKHPSKRPTDNAPAHRDPHGREQALCDVESLRPWRHRCGWAKPSVAAMRAAVMVGPRVCPVSSITTSSLPSHDPASIHGMSNGALRSRRPWISTPGMPVNLSTSRRRAPSSSHAACKSRRRADNASCSCLGRGPSVRRRAIGSHAAPASAEKGSCANGAIEFHATGHCGDGKPHADQRAATFVGEEQRGSALAPARRAERASGLNHGGRSVRLGEAAATPFRRVGSLAAGVHPIAT